MTHRKVNEHPLPTRAVAVWWCRLKQHCSLHKVYFIPPQHAIYIEREREREHCMLFVIFLSLRLVYVAALCGIGSCPERHW